MLTSRPAMEIVTAEEMRRIDGRAIRSHRIPSLLLMESAALGVVRAIEKRFPDLPERQVLVLCGKGNNGGDGLAAARHLHARGCRVHVLLTADPSRLSHDARVNFQAARGTGVPIDVARSLASWHALRRRTPDPHIVVDALFGTGLAGPVRGLLARVIRDVNHMSAFVVSVDLPSGLPADTGEVFGPAIEADLTVALCRPKIAHLLPPAALHTGKIEIAGIGIPDAAVASVRPKIVSIEPSGFADILPARSPDAHKAVYGHVLVVAGSEGKAGAAALAAKAALRTGVGLATVATPAGIRADVASFAAEIMTVGFPDRSFTTMVDPKSPGVLASRWAPRQGARASRGASFAETVVRMLLAQTGGKSAVALGPGLGREDDVATWIRRFVSACPLPLVLDADGLNAFEGRAAELSGRRRPLVLTPHPGEMARLVGESTRAIVRDRIGAARSLSRATRALVVLKGMATVVAAPDGRVFVNQTGNPGMATAGSGDVLTGVVGALLARRLDPLAATLFAVHIHGRAGDLAAAALGEEGLIAGDILEHLPEALREHSTPRDLRT